MKRIIKIFIVFLIVISIINIVKTNKNFAVETTVNPDTYSPTETTIEKGSSYSTLAGTIIGGFQAVGSIVSVLALVITGIRYMMSSVEEKAEYKNTFMYYIAGAILVFAISNISGIIYKIASGF